MRAMRFRPPGPVAAAALLAALLGVLAPHGAARPAAAEDAASGVDVVEETPAADRTVATNPDAPAWRGRRERLATALGADTVVLVLSHGATRGFTGQVRSDEFFYLCPFEATDAALVLFHAEGAVR